ncbi:P80 family lipoprotein [Metamycoplasma spumans]|uniref:P80 family lipoprotein n=1 Tax=Metamycoplasma spumans TaxID=92406 RepID=UPI0034DD1A76
MFKLKSKFEKKVYSKTVNKVFYSLALLPMISFATLSCITKQDYKNTITFRIRQFPEQDFLIFKKIIDRYNDLNNDYKVNLIMNRGRENIYSSIALQLETNDEFVPNIVLYYPSLANLVNKYNRSVNLDKEAKDANIYQKILNFNKRLGISNSNNEIFNMSIGLSSESLIINNIYLGAYLDKLLNHTKKLNHDYDFFNSNSNTIFKNAIEIYLNSDEKIKKQYEKAFENIEFHDDYIFKENFKFYDDLFLSTQSLLDLSNFINKSYTIKNSNKNSPLYVSNSANYFYKLLFDKANGNWADYFLKYKNDNNLDYENIFDLNNNSNHKLKWAYDLSLDNILNNNIQLRSNKIINNTEQLLNQYMFFISSTRAYNDIIKTTDNKKYVTFLNAPEKYNQSNTNGSFLSQGLNLIAIKKDERSDLITKNFINWLVNENNILEWKDNNNTLFLTPVAYLNYKLGYIYPNDQYLDFLNKNNYHNSITENISTMLKNHNIIPFQDPVDEKSDSFRKLIEHYFNYIIYDNINAKNDKDSLSFENFLKFLKINLI